MTVRRLAPDDSPVGVEAIRLPGQERRTRRADRVKNGVPLPRELIAQLDQFASELGIKPLGAR